MKQLVLALILLFLLPFIVAGAESSPESLNSFSSVSGEAPESNLNIPDLLSDDPYVPSPVKLMGDPVFEDDFSFNKPGFVVRDPLEPINRFFFEFNDRLYFWVLKPVKNGYSAVLPEDIRKCLGNFFSNLASPVRFLNNLLQGQFKDAGVVLERFLINSTVGVFGLGDPASEAYGLDLRQADFGQTLGKWGVEEGIYICWPALGPSTVRDSFGFFGDVYVHPVPYITQNTWTDIGYLSTAKINALSLGPDVYEELKRMSLDPYVASRQAFYEYRYSMIHHKKQ